ncbi:MAG: hypothetical protein LUH19_08740 [Lachnospiraceae bacterium]|nr:hypothetical protein [Lachnospiraceae bacterium]
MKKYMIIPLTAMLAFVLVSCGSTGNTDLSDQVITRSTDTAEETEATQEEASNEVVEQEVQEESEPFSFAYEGAVLMPGEAFDASLLPTADSTYTTPSCAIEGEDTVYNYTAFEVTVFDDGSGEEIYSIYFIDPNLTTPEGLALGDSLARVEELYGTGYEEDGTAIVYTRGETRLTVILQNEMVISIEYSLVL